MNCCKIPRSQLNEHKCSFCQINEPFQFIKFTGNEKIVEVLIENGANINSRDDDQATPLHRAVEQGLNT